MAGLFDILGVRARRMRHRDVQRIGQDFQAVLSKLGSLSLK
jgi:hypothetical protein